MSAKQKTIIIISNFLDTPPSHDFDHPLITTSGFQMKFTKRFQWLKKIPMTEKDSNDWKSFKFVFLAVLPL